MAYEIGKTIVSGRKSVTTPGVAEKLVATSTYCFMLIVSADLGNTNPVVVGGSETLAAGGSQKGIVLVPGNNPVTIVVNDVSKVYVDAQTASDAVCFTYFVP